ncbi:hypothetical protein V2P20_03445 [Methylobacter sp. Wu1]|uniref:LeuD/DmdB family oxidoreductase small subunit n=1 Tax=Methylobacter sp. Wu1 TaxID=3119359 RepID=UPI002F93C467
MNSIQGSVWLFGDNLNTDVIHPPNCYSLDPVVVKQGLFSKLDATLQSRLKPGDILVGGKNFGCGSSRETSIRSLLLNEIGAIVAVDFARIFFRNATNNGLPCLQFANAEDKQKLAEGETWTISFDDWTLTGQTGQIIPLVPAGSFVRKIWSEGGLLNLLPASAEDA